MKQRTTFAGVDLGSSSIKMLVQQRAADGAWMTLLDMRVPANLGRHTDATGALNPDAQQRALSALQTLLNRAAHWSIAPADIPVVATAAVRNAPNGTAFIQRVRDELGLQQAHIITGAQEAQVAYQATLLDVPVEPNARYATLDVGGGSFQLAVGTGARLEQGASTQVGSNAVQERWLPAGVILPADFAAADDALVQHAAMPLSLSVLANRRCAATGGVSLFLKEHAGSAVVPRQHLENLRLELGALEPEIRAAHIVKRIPDERREALGLGTPEAQLDAATKLPAKITLVLHVLRALGLDVLNVSATDARHLLIHWASQGQRVDQMVA